MKPLVISRPLTTADKSESFNQYLADVKDLSFSLTMSEEADLAKRIRAGDRVALNELVNSNLRFVISVANQFSAFAPIEDLVNEGNLGLIKAAHKFDETREVKFITYAVWWIRDSILKYISQIHPTVKITSDRQSAMHKLRRAERVLEQELGRKPVFSEITDYLNTLNPNHQYSDEYVESLSINCKIETISIDRSFDSTDDDRYPNEDTLIPPTQDLTTEEFSSDMTSTIRKEIFTKLKYLNVTERQVIQEFYGLVNKPKTLDLISKDLKISPERTRQIRDKALEKLKTQVDEEFRYLAD